MNHLHQLQGRSGSAPAPVPGATMEYLAFVLGAEHYAIDIRRVHEIRGFSHVTHIANAPVHILGIVNLRGVVVPILDLRIRFGNQSPTYDDHTIVIVLNVLGRVMGVVVDAVSDVVEIAHEHIMQPPQLGTSSLTQHIVGVAARDDRMLIVLDIEGALAEADTRAIDAVATAHAGA